MQTECAKLRDGARIVFHEGVADASMRLLLSAGTKPVDNMPDLQERYSPGAFIPTGPWRTPSTDDLECLLYDPARHERSWSVGVDVAIVRIPKEIACGFEAMLEDHGVRGQCDATSYCSVSKHPQWAENVAALNQCVAKLSPGRTTDAIYFRISDPGQFTVTKDEFGASRQRLAGMHLDSWDRLPLRHRHRSRNRLCINFSREARYSLFINLPLLSMFRYLGLSDPTDIYSDYRGLSVGQRFMGACPDYPVVRLQIEPGEAYILPTDNAIHDASTVGNRFPDITLTYLGYFSPA